MTADPASVTQLAITAGRLFAREMERQLTPLGLAPAHLPVLFALADGSTATQKTLASLAGVEQPTMAATLARMERDGLVSRHPDPQDRRSALVALTPLATERLDAVRRITSAVDMLALEQLAPADRQMFLALLSQVSAVLKAQDSA